MAIQTNNPFANYEIMAVLLQFRCALWWCGAFTVQLRYLKAYLYVCELHNMTIASCGDLLVCIALKCTTSAPFGWLGIDKK